MTSCSDLWSDCLAHDDTFAFEQDAIMQRDFIPIVPVISNWNRYLAFLVQAILPTRWSSGSGELYPVLFLSEAELAAR